MKLNINRVHHIAIICSDYDKSKKFYTEVIGCTILREIYRQERQSHKLDLSLNGVYVIELFSFPDPPHRPTHPEATGLRHLAFEVDDLDACVKVLENKNVIPGPIRRDEYTGKRFIFIADPDGLPLEFYER